MWPLRSSGPLGSRGMGRLGHAGGCRIRHRHLDGDAVGRRTVPAGTVVSHDAIGVAEAAEDIAVEEAGALHGLDHTGIATILRAVPVVAGDYRSDRGRPGETHLARFDRGRERLEGIPTGPDTCAILLRRL